MAPPNPMDKAAAAFKKEERQREGTKAMAEYQAARVAEERKTERLRALRLAQESVADAHDIAPPARRAAARGRAASTKSR